MNPLTYIPAAVRQYVYVGFGILGIVIGAIQTAFVAAALGQPAWLTISLSVYAYLGIALGFTAASNVHAEGTVEEFDYSEGDAG